LREQYVMRNKRVKAQAW